MGAPVFMYHETLLPAEIHLDLPFPEGKPLHHAAVNPVFRFFGQMDKQFIDILSKPGSCVFERAARGGGNQHIADNGADSVSPNGATAFRTRSPCQR